MATQKSATAIAASNMSPDGPGMPKLLFPEHVRGPQPTVENYFKVLTETPPAPAKQGGKSGSSGSVEKTAPSAEEMLWFLLFISVIWFVWWAFF